MNDKRILILKEYPIPKAVMKMAMPSIVGLLVMAIYNIVDTMFVAWLGTEATGATQVVFPMVVALGAVGMTFGIGGSSYISRLLGEGNKERAESVVTSNFVLAIVSGVILTFFGILFIVPTLKIFGATESMLPLSKDYGTYILLGSTAIIANQTLNNLLRAEGSAKNSMIAMIVGAVLNIILDPILIFGFDMGIKGAAIATTFSQFVTTAMLISQYTRKKSVLHLDIKRFTIDKELILEVFRMGSPSFARQILTSISMAALNLLAGVYGGAEAIAAMGIVLRTMMIVMYIIFGLSQGFQPVAGYNYGAKDIGRLRQAFWYTMGVSFAIAAVSSAVFVLFDDAILGIFRPTAEVLALSKSFLKVYVISILLMSLTNVVAVYYQAVGKSLPALVLSVSRQGLFLLPAVYFLPMRFGLTGVFIAQPVADVLTLIVTAYLFSRNNIKTLEV